jgi:hypothetical protein
VARGLTERSVLTRRTLEISGGVGEIELELLKAGAARARNLELARAYEQEARMLADPANS